MSEDASILVVEDDGEIFSVIKETLAEMSFQCQQAADGLTGSELAQRGGYQMIILDLGLPGKEGVDICKEIRQTDDSTPILVLSAREDTLSKALLLELGADDYVTKPFDVLELKARVKALLRRAKSSTKTSEPREAFVVGQLRIDFPRYKVFFDEKEVSLTPREYELVAILASQAGRPLTREQLNEEIYGYQTKGYELSINTHINRIRTKIEPNPSKPQYILTVRGVGYCMVDETDFSSAEE